MRRVEGWESRLEKYIRETIAAPFEYGKCDCVTWCMDWFYLMSGVDLYSDYRGKYSDLESAKNLIDSVGGLAYAIGQQIPERKTGFHKRGDIALCNINGNETLGIIASGGLVFFKMNKGTCAKKVIPIKAWGID